MKGEREVIHMEEGLQQRTLRRRVSSVVEEGFGEAANYHQARPDYTRELAEYFMRKLHFLDEAGKLTKSGPDPVTVLELGSGTGKFTRVMLEALEGANVRVIASDPVENMCKKFKELLPEVEVMQCFAQSIGKRLGFEIESGKREEKVIVTYSFSPICSSTIVQERC